MSKRPIEVEDLLKFTFVGDPQMSPLDNLVAFTHKTIQKNKYVTQIWVAAEGEEPRPFTQGKKDRQARWSPDGTQLAFVADRDECAQIHLIPRSGGEAKALTQLPEGAIGPVKWAPDGKHLAFLFRPTLPDRTKEAAKARETDGLSNPPWVLDDIQYRLDGDGYFGRARFALYIADVETGAHQVLVNAAVDGDYSFAWHPASDRLFVTHTVAKRPFFEVAQDEIFSVNLDGSATKIEGLPRGNKGSVAVSPDGNWLAYGANLDPEDTWGTRNQRLCIARIDGTEFRDLSEGVEYDLGVGTATDTAESGYGAFIAWLSDGAGLLVNVGWQGSCHPVVVDLAGNWRFVTDGPRQVVAANPIGDQIPMAFQDPTHLPEIGIATLDGAVHRLTNFNAWVHDEVEVVTPKESWIDSTSNKDGSPSRLHAWTLEPPTPNGATVIEVHGGPHAQYGWAFFHEFQVLAAAGYRVVYSNPRGSKGYGEGFCHEIFGDWGNKDWEDVEALSASVMPESARLGIMGGSYGGYMTNWAVGHSTAYRSAITDRCVSNLVSMSGNSDFPFNGDRYFKGLAFGDLPEIAELWRQSPVAAFDKVTTPMLIIHSEGDLRCNVEQSEQVFTILQQKGVKSRFVRFPANSSHGLSRSGPPDLRLTRLREILRWWGETL